LRSPVSIRWEKIQRKPYLDTIEKLTKPKYKEEKFKAYRGEKMKQISLQTRGRAGYWWLMPVILVTQEAESRRILV
jgi:hypothetical protein